MNVSFSRLINIDLTIFWRRIQNLESIIKDNRTTQRNINCTNSSVTFIVLLLFLILRFLNFSTFYFVQLFIFQFSIYIYISSTRRCPDLKKPCAVTYDLERDRLEPLDDDVVSLDTDEGPLCLSGILNPTIKINFRYKIEKEIKFNSVYLQDR